jgi:capsular polysaccharide biosynthesis protein
MRQEAQSSEHVRQSTDHLEDEIKLIDLLRIIWKWKYLIVGGTTVCAVAALVITLMMPKIYRIETVIRPGILSIGEGGIQKYIDTPENIKALIETGAFDKKILDSFAESNTAEMPGELRFKATLPKSSSTLKINYDTAHVEQGIAVLKLLGEFLIEEYGNIVGFFQNEIDRDIKIGMAGIQKINTMKRSHRAVIESIAKRIQELENDIGFINKNTAYLNKERNNLLTKGKDESNILSLVLYSNTIQQNLQLSNDYKSEINNFKLNRETELQQISELENELQAKLAEIDNLKMRKSVIQNIQIIQKPYSSKYPIKPKKSLYIITAVLAAIFAMVFLSFVFEYLNQNRQFFKKNYHENSKAG